MVGKLILFHYPAFLDQNTIPFILDLIILVLFIFFIFYNIHTFISITFMQYIYPSPFAEASLHFFIACLLSGDDLPVVPSRESNSGLPYSKPTRFQLSHAAPYTEPRRTILSHAAPLLKHSRRITNDDNCLLHTVRIQCCGAVTMIRIRVLGSVQLTYGSGSCSFCQ
jgi:hypothetical protein